MDRPLGVSGYPLPHTISTDQDSALNSAGSDTREISTYVKTLIRKEKSAIKLAVDGEVTEVDVDPVVSLADYLRQKGKTCTKIGCGEGGCGACTTLIGTWGADETQPQYRTVNACLLSLASCDGMAIITGDGLGNSQKGFHPIQERLAENNGSQCGFCSPGMVMSMYGWLKKTDNNPKKEDAANCLDGNLCRCTGYRAILKAYQSLVNEKVDLSRTDLPFPDELKGYTRRPLYFAGSGKEWYVPLRIPDVFTVLKDIPSSAKVQVTAGNTSRGIYKADDQIDVFVDLRGIPELTQIKDDDNSIAFGSGTTIAKFISTLEEYIQKKGKEAAPGFPSICDHAKKIAGNQIRNLGTIGGNLMITKSLGFQSDLATILSGAGAEIVIANDNGEETQVLLSHFLTPSYPMLSAKSSLLKSVILPFSAGEIFKSFKVAKRSQNSHAIVNASFRFKKVGETIEKATMVFGALVSSPLGPVGPFQATKTEEALKGQAISTGTFQKALNALVMESWWPKDEYEQQLSKSYLCRIFTALTGEDRSDINLKTTLSNIRPVAEYGDQNVNWAVDEETAPISKPMTKTNAKLQTAGEASFCADITEPRDVLYGAYVPINLPNMKLTKVDPSDALKMPGVVAYIDARDIPAGGKNVGDPDDQMLFVPVGEVSQFGGQPAGLILADTQKHAEMAVKKVRLSTSKSDRPLLFTAEQCIHVDGRSKVVSNSRGDTEKALKEAKHTVKGSCFCAAQRHFPMEPQNAMAVPREGGQMTMYHSQQMIFFTHKFLSTVLGIPKHQIVVNAPLVGGGFGAKLTRGLHVALSAGVAAKKMKRPVRVILNRNQDMLMTGGRHACTIDYEVGFNDDGKITALKCKTLADAGFNLDYNQGREYTTYVCSLINEALDGMGYGVENLDASTIACLTDKPSATVMRAPGEPQGSFIIETILEHIAAELKLDPQAVREVNIFKDKAEQAALANKMQMDVSLQKKLGTDPFFDHPLHCIWEHLKKTANHAAMTKEVEDFNAKNTWRKRGISMTPTKWLARGRPQQATMMVYEDGTVLITVDGTEIGQGLWVKVQQFASYYLSQICETPVPMECIQIQPVGTDRIAQGSLTAASTTSEGCCEAVKQCCNQLKEVLQKKIDARESKEGITFAELCKEACGNGRGDELMHFTGRNEHSIGFSYYVYGAAISMVEIDALTGETTILASKLCYDCGKSLNPLIDAGQCEGAFVQGLGFFLREEVIEDEKTGELISDGTWEYKIPCVQDVPLNFEVEFFPRPFTHEKAVVSSKCCGEPPLVLAASAFYAVRNAIAAARKEQGLEGFFRMDAPATPRVIALLCNPKIENFQLSTS